MRIKVIKSNKVVLTPKEYAKEAVQRNKIAEAMQRAMKRVMDTYLKPKRKRKTK